MQYFPISMFLHIVIRDKLRKKGRQKCKKGQTEINSSEDITKVKKYKE